MAELDGARKPVILTIAGSDPYGGAGIQVDIKTIHALGGYALSAITSLTAQNSLGVQHSHITPSEVLRMQIMTLMDDIVIDGIKIGMLGDEANVSVVADILAHHPHIPTVLDPIIISSSGKELLSKRGIEILKESLIPIVDLVTPNLPELYRLSGIKIATFADAQKALTKLKSNALLIKGGHSSDPNQSCDLFVDNRGDSRRYCAQRIQTAHSHGTGCILSSAIATLMASGKTIHQSINHAKKFLTTHMANSHANISYHHPSSNRSKNIL